MVVVSDELIILDFLFTMFHVLLVIVSDVFLPLAGFESLHKQLVVIDGFHLNL